MRHRVTHGEGRGPRRTSGTNVRLALESPHGWARGGPPPGLEEDASWTPVHGAHVRPHGIPLDVQPAEGYVVARWARNSHQDFLHGEPSAHLVPATGCGATLCPSREPCVASHRLRQGHAVSSSPETRVTMIVQLQPLWLTTRFDPRAYAPRPPDGSRNRPGPFIATSVDANRCHRHGQGRLDEPLRNEAMCPCRVRPVAGRWGHPPVVGASHRGAESRPTACDGRVSAFCEAASNLAARLRITFASIRSIRAGSLDGEREVLAGTHHGRVPANLV